MRTLYISLGLALLLLLAQQGAVLHEVSHFCQAGGQAHYRLQADIASDKDCQLCLAYSQVTNPAGNTVAVPYFAPSSCTTRTPPPCAVIPRDVLNPRSRGPPLPHFTV